MLATLSVFVEGWTVDAAVHVARLTEDEPWISSMPSPGTVW